MRGDPGGHLLNAAIVPPPFRPREISAGVHTCVFTQNFVLWLANSSSVLNVMWHSRHARSDVSFPATRFETSLRAIPSSPPSCVSALPVKLGQRSSLFLLPYKVESFPGTGGMKRQPPSPAVASPSTDTLYRLGGKYKRHDHGPSPSSSLGVSNTKNAPGSDVGDLHDPDLVFPVNAAAGGNAAGSVPQLAEGRPPNNIPPRRAQHTPAVSGNGVGGRWTKEEDEMLRAAVAAIGPRNWKRISQEFLKECRSDVQCLHRWQKVLRPGLVKGPWTREEDDTIVHSIQSGVTKWSEIAAQIPGRIGKQCRERWFNHLDPTIKKGAWTEQEDGVLIVRPGGCVAIFLFIFMILHSLPRCWHCVRRRNISSVIVGVKLRSYCRDVQKTL